MRKKASDIDCKGSGQDPIFTAKEVAQDLGQAIGLGAVTGCLSGGIAGTVELATMGFAATAGVGLGIIKGGTGLEFLRP